MASFNKKYEKEKIGLNYPLSYRNCYNNVDILPTVFIKNENIGK